MAASQIETEFNRLQAVYESLGKDLNLQPPATQQEINSISATTGVEVDDDLKALWRIANGSGDRMWFAEGEGEFTPYGFLSVADVLRFWSMFAPYDKSHYDTWHDDEEWGERDPRIQKHFLHHKLWIPLANFNGGSHMLYFDADPTADGSAGQIINFIHDPDGVFWTAKSFLEFFKTSNDTLEEWLEDPDALRNQLWLWR